MRTALAALPSLAGACALAWACWGCDGEDRRASVSDASDALQRHRAAFVAFDRWVRRAMQGADLLGDERALAETLFANARGERTVLAAWVEQAGKVPIAVALPAGEAAPAMTAALRLRDAELGTLEVLPGASCRERTRAKAASPGAPPSMRRCAIVARAAPGPNGELRVTAAFED